MKKILKITILLFIVSSIMQIALEYIINEQLLSRILYGVDYSTYFSNYATNGDNLMAVISGEKPAYSWLFTISKYVIGLVCVLLLFFTVKRLSKNNTLSKKELLIIIILFSILSLHTPILYVLVSLSIPPISYFIEPAIFIISAFIFLYKMLYKNH